jgi:flagellar hook-associated protein 3 FlgL
MYNRITGTMLTGSTLNDINSALAKLQRSSNELSSGRKILEPSDDPYGAGRSLDLQSQLDGLGSYTSSVKDGISWTQTAEGSLTNMGEAMQRVRQLLISAGNGTNSQADLSNIATEVTQLTESIKQDANTQYAGQYVFAGTLTSTAPYAHGENDEYQGNTGTVARSIGSGATVTISSDLSSVLGAGKAAADGKTLDVLRTIVQHLTEGTAEGRAALTTTDLKAVNTNIEGLLQLQSNNGSSTDQLQTAATRIESLQSSITSALSNTLNTDVAQATIAYSTQQAAYQAALHASASIVQESLLNFLH